MDTSEAGLANERTGLAWQRTALSLVTGSAILSRFTFERLGIVAVVSFAVVASLAGWLFWEARGRYRHAPDVERGRRPRGGRAPATVAAAVAVLASTELAALFLTG